MKNLLNNIKKGIGYMRDKAIQTIVNVGTALKNRENRIIIGIILTSSGLGFIVSGYIKMPQEV